jgi:hypothetical protein
MRVHSSALQQPSRSCRVPAAAFPLARSGVVITTVNFFPDDDEVALRGMKRIGLPRKADGWDLDYRLHLARPTGAREPEMFAGVLVLHCFAG